MSFWDGMKEEIEKEFRFGTGTSDAGRIGIFAFMGVGAGVLFWSAAKSWGSGESYFHAAVASFLALWFVVGACAYSRGARFLIKLAVYVGLITLFSCLPSALKEWLLYAFLLVFFFFSRAAIDGLLKRVYALETKQEKSEGS